jgi:hypothetical protein
VVLWFNQHFRLKDLVIEVVFWNGTVDDWDAVYQRNGPNNGSHKFEMAFYPYEGNSTLLCHTLTEGLGSFGTKFRIKPDSLQGTGKLFYITVKGSLTQDFQFQFFS